MSESPRKKRARLIDVAALAGVAPNTASTILNRRPNSWASKETAARVFAAAEEIGYRPSKAAVGLRLGRFNAAGLVIPDIQNPYFSQMADHLDRALEAEGIDLIIENARSDLERETKCLRNLLERQIDCAFMALMNPVACEPVLREGGAGLASVLFSGVGHLPLSVDTVQVDYSTGAREAVDYLFRMGHRRFAYLSGLAKGQSPDARINSFNSLLTARRVPEEHQLVVYCEPTFDAAHTGFAELLHTVPEADRPTAVLCVNDVAAIGVMRAASEFGLSAPEDFSLVGVDDIPIASILPRALTTVRAPIDEQTREAVKMMREQLDAKGDREHRSFTVESRLIIRETSGAPPRGV